jgi:acyl transferase domain-containing protein
MISASPRNAEVVVLFPGQGSQVRSMSDTVERWCPELGEAMVRTLGEDPFSRVTGATAFAQPAIFCAGVAGWRAITRAFEPVAVVGHSLGEFAALVAAGALDARDALQLVIRRGRLMQDAETRQSGAMIAISGPSFESLPAIMERCGVVIANDNAPHQVVLSGPAAAIERTREEVTAAGLRAVRLPVRGAFHSPLMADVSLMFRSAVTEIEFRQPQLLALCSTTCAPFSDMEEELALGITRPVLWRQSVEYLHGAGFRRVVEAGPGTVLSRLVQQTVGDALDIVTLDQRGARDG